MKRVLYFDWFSSATEHYRLYPLDYINCPDLTIIRSNEQNPDWRLLDSFDIIVISRPSAPKSLAVIKLAKSLHKRVISDYDDDCLHLDQYNPMYTYYRDDKQNLIDCIMLSDEVWVTTEAVKKSFRLYNKNIHIIPNALNNYEFLISNKKAFNRKKVASWRGGFSHEGDMYELGVPEKIIKIVNDNKDWKFKFFGQRFLYYEKRCGENYIAHLGHGDFVSFQRMMQENNAAVFFYPLSDTPFNRSKSNCSWIENTYCGSAFFGNTALPEFQKPGISDLKLLEKAISEQHWKYLKEQHELSWKYIKENLLLTKINKLRTERLLK